MRTYEEPDLTVSTRKVYPLRFIDSVIGNYTLPMPSDYKFELKKVYVQEPTRNNAGQIAIFPDKFFVPYFTVTWNVMKFSDYAQLMRLIQVDQIITEYYDTNDEKYRRAYFYVQQPTYNKLYSMRQEFDFVTNLQLVFAGTMNPIDQPTQVTIKFNANGGTGEIASIKGVTGDEFSVPYGESLVYEGYKLSSWNTSIDGNGQKYAMGAVAVMIDNITLYAQWELVDEQVDS
jgi:hypothetical protein|nr:MAG TPA: hypothetical protein [Caudoviricetes sp.]